MNQHPKNLSLAALVLMGLIGVTRSGSPHQSHNVISSHLSSSVKPKHDSSPRVSIEAVSDITPSARGCKEVSGAYVVGSFLYWNSGYSDVELSARRESTGDENQKFKTISMDKAYSPGFQIGLGANFARDGWDLFLNWTSLQSHPSQSAQTQTPKLVALDSEPNNIFLSNHFQSDWHFNFNVLDLELGRLFYISHQLSLRPHAGLKSAWIQQNLKITYWNVINQNAASFQTPQQGQFKDHMWGMGPRLGLKSRWILGSCNIAFLGNIAASLLWEDFHPSSSVSYLDPNGDPPRIHKIHGPQQQLNAVAEAFLGLDWGHCFQNKTYLNLAAGYEMQYWWDQNKTTHHLEFFQSNRSLNLHGLTASLRLDF